MIQAALTISIKENSLQMMILQIILIQTVKLSNIIVKLPIPLLIHLYQLVSQVQFGQSLLTEITRVATLNQCV